MFGAQGRVVGFSPNVLSEGSFLTVLKKTHVCRTLKIIPGASLGNPGKLGVLLSRDRGLWHGRQELLWDVGEDGH